MQDQEFVYPAYTDPLISAFAGCFEAAFIVLHPFVRVPDSLSWRQTRQYPDDDAVRTHGSKCAWMEVAHSIGLQNCAQINQALLTSIGSLPAHVADPVHRNLLATFLQRESVWMPSEGRFEPLLQDDMLAAFVHAGFDELIFVPETAPAETTKRLPVQTYAGRGALLPAPGTLLAPDHSFLFTVDWDSFFTLFYGTRTFITEIASERNLEGFFVAPTTEHAWYNYSMGCATVTLSPEHWQSLAATTVRS